MMLYCSVIFLLVQYSFQPSLGNTTPPFFSLERKLSLSILKPLGLSGLTSLPDPG